MRSHCDDDDDDDSSVILAADRQTEESALTPFPAPSGTSKIKSNAIYVAITSPSPQSADQRPAEPLIIQGFSDSDDL